MAILLRARTQTQGKLSNPFTKQWVKSRFEARISDFQLRDKNRIQENENTAYLRLVRDTGFLMQVVQTKRET